MMVTGYFYALKAYIGFFIFILAIGLGYLYLDEINFTQTIQIGDLKATVSRDKASGIAIIDGVTQKDVAMGIGYIHARDRSFQTLIQRTMAQGRLSELLGASNGTIEMDKYLRDHGFARYTSEAYSVLEKEDISFLESYCEGFNHYFKSHRGPIELQLTGIDPVKEPLTPQDITLVGKLMVFSGLAENQGKVEKFIIELLQSDEGTKLAKSLYKPYLDDVDDEILSIVRRVKIQRSFVLNKILNIVGSISASNNWVVNGSFSDSGRPILVADPHIRIDASPTTWYEVILRYQSNYVIGITVPGAPYVVMGRNKKASYTFTYGMGDLWDYEMTHCRRRNNQLECKVREEKQKPIVKNDEIEDEIPHDNSDNVKNDKDTLTGSVEKKNVEEQTIEQSKDELTNNAHSNNDHSNDQQTEKESTDGYAPVLTHIEIIKRKGMSPIEHKVYELPHTRCTLEMPQDPEEGYYLCHAFFPKFEGGARSFMAIRKAMDAFTTRELMDILKHGDFGFNYLVADDEGNIGLQQSGRFPNRQHSGLFPFPSWDPKFKYSGIVEPEGLVSIYNPKRGWLATANHQINKNPERPVVNANLGNYRLDRISTLISSHDGKFNSGVMKTMLMDLKSEQASAFMDILRPILRKGILNFPGVDQFLTWNDTFDPNSKLPTLFDKFHRALLFDVYTRIFEEDYFEAFLPMVTHKWYLDRFILDYSKEDEWLWKGESQEELFLRVFQKIWNQYGGSLANNVREVSLDTHEENVEDSISESTSASSETISETTTESTEGTPGPTAESSESTQKVVKQSTSSNSHATTKKHSEIHSTKPAFSTLKNWGEENAVRIEHLFWRNILPKSIRDLLGIDKTLKLGGFPSTISPVSHGDGRVTGVSWRFIADLGERFVYTNLPGGVSESIFSSLYMNDLKNWFHGVYKRLSPI